VRRWASHHVLTCPRKNSANNLCADRQRMGQRLQSVTGTRRNGRGARLGNAGDRPDLRNDPRKVRSTWPAMRVAVIAAAFPSTCRRMKSFFAAEYIQAEFLPRRPGRSDRTHRRLSGARRWSRHRERESPEASRAPSCAMANVHLSGPTGGLPVHHTSNPAVSPPYRQSRRRPGAVYIPTLRARMFAVMLGMDEGSKPPASMTAPTDLARRCMRPLTNSLCQVLWMRRKAAFPIRASCAR